MADAVRALHPFTFCGAYPSEHGQGSGLEALKEHVEEVGRMDRCWAALWQSYLSGCTLRFRERRGGAFADPVPGRDGSDLTGAARRLDRGQTDPV